MIEHLEARSVRAGEVPTQRTVQVGRSQGTVRLLTGWENVGNRAGHKLTLQGEQWLGEAFLLNRAGFPAQIAGLAVIAELASLRVISEEGARKPFIGTARRSILDQALRTLLAAQRPQVTFYADLNHSELVLTPYVGLFGSLRARDRVEIVIDLAIPELRTAG